MNNKVRYTLITGASAGIGKAISAECAKRNQNLILVALPDTGLHEVATALNSNYHIDVKVVELDLLEPRAVYELYDWCGRQHLAVNVLINNAGTGNHSPFATTSLEDYLRIIKLNTEVVVALAKLFLPKLREHPESYMLNVGSFVAFMPIPFKSVYSASKSFVLTFSRALQSELSQYGVHVSCLCPGPTLTETVKRKNRHLITQNTDLLSLSPETVAKAAIEGLFAKKGVIVPGWKNRMLITISKFVPFSIKSYILNNIFDSTTGENTDPERSFSEPEGEQRVSQ